MEDYSSSSDSPWYASRGSITSVVIDPSVTSIGGWAFYSCSSLTSVTIPASVTSIGAGAFSSCDNLTSFSVDAGNPVYSSYDNALYNKDRTNRLHGLWERTGISPSRTG